MLIMGGDVTGKTVVPLVEESDGTFHFNFQGQEFRDLPAGAIGEYETRVMNAGLYPYRVSVNEY